MGDKLRIKPNINNQNCPLCETRDISKFYQDRYRKYFRCGECNLIFVPSESFLSVEEEKIRYDFHQNSPDDKRYRQFLNRIFVPMQEFLESESHGLDFGSGPGPTLSLMFEEAGHSMSIYDHFYARDFSVLEKQYDFITATEVLEHLRSPKMELDRLWTCLKPGGKMGIMTKLLSDNEIFARWHYKKDLTHVCFFSRSTFKWLASQWKAELIFVDEDVMIFHKKVV